MTKILIIESNSPELIKNNARLGTRGNAESYGDALIACQAGLNIQIAAPYSPDFTIDSLQLEDIDGVVFTGSCVEWSVSDKKAKPLRQSMEKVLTVQKPILGSCNGMQLACVVLGGRIHKSPNGMELGIARDIQLTEHGSQHALHEGRRKIFSCLCIHRDEVAELPSGAELTATNQHSEVQAMVYEQSGQSIWGMQYHPEGTPSHFADIVDSPGGFFSNGASLAGDLRKVSSTPIGEAASRLGARGDDLVPSILRTELHNWLNKIH